MEIIEMRIRGQLKQGWSDWMEGLTVTTTCEGDTVVSGVLRDQSALCGLVSRLPNLNLRLISLLARSQRNSGETRRCA